MVKNFKYTTFRKKGALKFDKAWLSGFIDIEGCFSAKIRNASDLKLNFKVEKNLLLIKKKNYLSFLF